MDPLQVRVLDALEPFLALSKSATSPHAASDLITRATSASGTYVFAELLERPNIQSLRHAGDKFASYVTLLEIFAWGTWQDYNGKEDAVLNPDQHPACLSKMRTATPNLPALNEQQKQKLRLLSLLSLCTDPSALTYAHLQSALGLPTARSLEDLIIGATYAGLITAKLSPSTSRVHISFISPLRDLAPASVLSMLEALVDWDARCTSVLDELMAQTKETRRKAGERRAQAEEMHKALERAAQQSIERGTTTGKRAAADGEGLRGDDYEENGGSGGGGLGLDDTMEIDDVDGDWPAAKSSWGQGGSGSRKNARARFRGSGRRLG